jgi:preprotein translocase subunit SecA
MLVLWYLFQCNFFTSLFHNIVHQYATREAEIVAQAGRKHAITISTNMAGRGTDIILGGNPKVSVRAGCLSLFYRMICGQNFYRHNDFG